MNILLINHYAGSPKYGMEYRPYYLAKEWVKLGHKVTIIAASFSHLRMREPLIGKSLQSEMIDGIKYTWIKVPAYYSSTRRILNILFFVFRLRYYSKRLSDIVKPDVVIASSTYPLDIYPAKSIAKRTKAKLCYEVHDIWPLSPMVIGGYPKWHPFIIIMQMAENKACRCCDKLVSLLWNSESHFREHGLEKGKFACVPNGFNMEEWTNDKLSVHLPSKHVELFGRLKNEGKIVVGFAGGFAASGALKTLIAAAKDLRDYDQVAFVLVGKGPEEHMLKELVANDNLKNVFFLPSVDKSLIPALDSHFGIAYMGGVHSVLHQYGTSYNKLTDYMLCGLPIIRSIDEPNSLVDKVKCGVTVEAENHSAVAESILQLVNMSSDERKSMGIRGREYAMNNLEYSMLAKKFLEYIFN